ncbi:uncharacterized protein LOC127734153 isoform X2 [Mytilus californianus]|uniref:uncharacterized protein LOC127734153 isoform X2 n=1 Tax=Mytilus californianus TaxID=6549 RepID=UPI002246953B|nr:uncharacterized protein LOC127734153 isoform X2 [Mytilus californianus]
MHQLLQKMKSDRMNELRQIQHGERPVTGTDSRDNINSFFAKRLDAQAAAQGKENVPVNVDDVEEHRPDTVVVEIQGLVEQHRVSNVLTTNFRRRLENIIRGSISSVTRNNSPRPSPQSSARPSPTPQNSERQSPVPAPRSSTTTPTSGSQSPVPQPRLRNTAIPQHVEDRSRSNSLASTNSNSSSENETTPVNPPIPPYVERLVPQEYRGSNLVPVTLEDMENLHRETVVQEISELVHRQLVTSSLESTFRNVLEITMQDRLGQTDTDGQRVQEFVRNIHPTQPIQRNDFSNIGLPPPGNDNWDNISITSVSAHAVPYTQSNLHMSREIHSLKSQLEEMKNMMKLSFDLQLDIQRAIRQEVSAALAQVQVGAEGGSPLKKCKPVSDTHCLICLDNHSDSVLYQCGHMCVCYACGRHLMSRNAKCPVCRAPIKDIIRAYKSNED